MATPSTSPPKVTELLEQVANGDKSALGEVFTILYADLKRIAHRHLKHERRNHTLNSATLVAELFSRLNKPGVKLQHRSHLFGAAFVVLQWYLKDYARKRNRLFSSQVELDEELLNSRDPEQELVLPVGDVLEELRARDSLKYQIVLHRDLEGYTEDETVAKLAAQGVDISPATVRRECSAARMWLERNFRRKLADAE